MTPKVRISESVVEKASATIHNSRAATDDACLRVAATEVKSIATTRTGHAVFEIASVRVPVIHPHSVALLVKHRFATHGSCDVNAIVSKELHGYVFKAHRRRRVNAVK